MSDQKLKNNQPLPKLMDFTMEEGDLCPPWWPRLLWRLHFPIGGGVNPPNPVNYPPIIDQIMAGLHVHTMSYLMQDQKAAQEIRNIAEKQLGDAVRNLSKAHEENVGKRKAA
ncbi:MAG: hypothetical protein JST79_19685 [Acidobacteria bacterium]|jgi:hypothetical protein|nr:hypothetical protein [Acidobacteriota bacterium]